MAALLGSATPLRVDHKVRHSLLQPSARRALRCGLWSDDTIGRREHQERDQLTGLHIVRDCLSLAVETQNVTPIS